MTTATAPPRLFGDDHAAHPEHAHEALRRQGPVAWAEISPGVYALVVTTHRAARDLLIDTHTWSKDSRGWLALAAGEIPQDSPVLALMAYRPSLLYADGPAHARLRRAMDDCIETIDVHLLRETTQRHATALIASLAPGGHADLMAAYADRLPLLVFTDLLGCSADMVARMVTASQGVIGAGPGALAAAREFAACLADLISAKKQRPGHDITSWMLAHPAALTDEEMLHQLYCLVGAGVIPTAAWIGSTVHLLLSDDGYTAQLAGGTVTIRRAMETVLWTRSPMATFSTHFARLDTVLHGVPVAAGVPVMISHALTGTDPTLAGLGTDNRAHLAWSAGPHRCPADTTATVIAQTAVECLLDQLWGPRLNDGAVVNRPGPFHSCPAALHIRFQPNPAGGTSP